MGNARTDVLVLGLGPAERAAAQAARAGLQVLAVDRKREAGLPVQCAEFVPPMIGTEVSALAGSTRQPIRGMVTFLEGDAPISRPIFRATCSIAPFLTPRSWPRRSMPVPAVVSA
jgi:flavin-dependent dehydrogenase